MDFLLLNGEKVCPIKMKARSGRVRFVPGSVSFPRTINFWCSKRPLPRNSYEIKLRGIGTAAINVRAVTAPGGDNYDVYADVVSPASVSSLPLKPFGPRNRRIPGRATGHLSFVLKWSSGKLSQTCSHSTSLGSAIRLFTERLRQVPFMERESAIAHMDAEVRKARGGVRRVTLASWSATQPLPEFFRAARSQWKRLPKEYDD